MQGADPLSKVRREADASHCKHAKAIAPCDSGLRRDSFRDKNLRGGWPAVIARQAVQASRQRFRDIITDCIQRCPVIFSTLAGTLVRELTDLGAALVVASQWQL